MLTSRQEISYDYQASAHDGIVLRLCSSAFFVIPVLVVHSAMYCTVYHIIHDSFLLAIP